VSVLDFVFAVAGIIGLTSCPFLLLNWFRFWRSGNDSQLFPIKTVIVFVGAVVLSLVTCWTATPIARMEVLASLDRPWANQRVAINGEVAQNAEEILNALQKMREVPAHHSSPSHEIRIDISDRSHLRLVLARDSDNPREYWIFYPRHFITQRNEIGHIISPLFDAY
jgi:hypothetical protein